jgi:hypothetical protein
MIIQDGVFWWNAMTPKGANGRPMCVMKGGCDWLLLADDVQAEKNRSLNPGGGAEPRQVRKEVHVNGQTLRF